MEIPEREIIRPKSGVRTDRPKYGARTENRPKSGVRTENRPKSGVMTENKQNRVKSANGAGLQNGRVKSTATKEGKSKVYTFSFLAFSQKSLVLLLDFITKFQDSII